MDVVALLTKLQDGFEFEVGDVEQTGVPGVVQLLQGGFWAAEGKQAVEELFGTDASYLVEVHGS